MFLWQTQRSLQFINFGGHLSFHVGQTLFEAFNIIFCGGKAVLNFQLSRLSRRKFGIEKFQSFRRVSGICRIKLFTIL